MAIMSPAYKIEQLFSARFGRFFCYELAIIMLTRSRRTSWIGLSSNFSFVQVTCQ